MSAADAPVPRYRLEAGVEHHAMSGHGGDPVCEPVHDRRGEWVKWADVEAYVGDLTYTKDEQVVGREVDRTFSRLQERQLTLAQKEAEMLRAEREVFAEQASEDAFEKERLRQQLLAARDRIEVLRQQSTPATDQRLQVQNRLHAEQVQQLLGELVDTRHRLAAAESENARLAAVIQGSTP